MLKYTFYIGITIQQYNNIYIMCDYIQNQMFDDIINQTIETKKHFRQDGAVHYAVFLPSGANMWYEKGGFRRKLYNK